MREVEKCGRTKNGHELSIVNCGKQKDLFVQILLGVLEIRMFFSSVYGGRQGTTSYMKIL